MSHRAEGPDAALNALERVLASQSQYWVEGTHDVGDAYARLALAMIGLHARMLTIGRQEEQEEAAAFLFGDGVEPFLDYLGLDPDWTRQCVCSVDAYIQRWRDGHDLRGRNRAGIVMRRRRLPVPNMRKTEAGAGQQGAVPKLQERARAGAAMAGEDEILPVEGAGMLRERDVPEEHREWFRRQKAKMERNPMIHIYGRTDGRKCGECKHLTRYKQANAWHKCALRQNTGGRATDHGSTWNACGRFEEAKNG